MRWSPLILPPLLLITLAATTVEPLPAPTQPATQPESRLFLSLSEILDRTPDSLRPRPGKNWLNDTKPQFDAWLNQQIAGMIVEEEVHVAGTIVTKDPNVHDPHTEWSVRFFSHPHHLPDFGSTNDWQIELPVLQTDAASAKRWQTKVGITLRLRGTIKSVSVEPAVTNPTQIPTLTFTITLDHPTLTLPNERAQSATNPAR